MPVTLIRKRPKYQFLGELTQLEAEEESKLNRQQEEERLAVLGQVSDQKAKKWIQEEWERVAEEDKKARERDYAILTSLRGKKKKYNHHLAKVLIQYLGDEAIPKKYKLKINWNSKGVIIRILEHDYAKGIASCGIPNYDVMAAKIIAVQTGNTIAKLEGHISQTPSGVFIPTKQEANIVIDKYNHESAKTKAS